LDIPALVGGDFNILRFANEKNKNGGVTRFFDEFNSIISKFALRELPLSGGFSLGLIIKIIVPWRSWIGS
jgi:hypothetical protein